MPQSHHSRVIILGSGPAGCTAAIYSARAGLQPTMIHGLQPGGQMTITTDVENYPGFAEVVQGPWLMQQFEEQARSVDTIVVNDIIIDLDVTVRPIICTGDSGDTYTADALVIATGAQARWLDLESEQKYQGFGVSACATCDGFFYRGKPVCVIGGGNTAAEEALYLTNFASRVTLIHRRDSLRAEKILQERLLRHDKITVLWDHVLNEVVGEDTPPSVTGVKVKNVKTAEINEMAVDGVFVAIGHVPQTELFKGKLAMDDEGYLFTAPDSTATEVAGVFAAGDVQDKIYRQAVTAAGTGCMAALEVERYLAALEDGAAEAAE